MTQQIFLQCNSGAEKGKRYSVQSSIVIGRALDCDIVLNELLSSRKHAQVSIVQDGTVVVEDLRSSNGTFVNNKRIVQQKELKDGDVVQIANVEFSVIMQKTHVSGLAGWEDVPQNSIIKDAKNVVDQFHGIWQSFASLPKIVPQEQISKIAQLQLMFQLNMSIQQSTSSADMLQQISPLLLHMCQGESVYVWSVARNGTTNLRSNFSVQPKIPTMILGKTIKEYVLKNQSAMWLPKVQTDPRFTLQDDIQEDVSLFVIPLLHTDRVLSTTRTIALIAISVANHNLTEQTQNQYLETFMMASSILADALYKQDALEEAMHSQQELIELLSTISDSASLEAQGHIQRISKYAMLFASILGLSAEDRLLLAQSIMLHDIGQISIPADILYKTTPLTTEEWDIIRKHSLYGKYLLSKCTSSVLQMSAIIAIQHHENWDGTGYPAQLKGEEIHVFARITRILDVFENLGRHKKYREAYSASEITAIMQQSALTIFDPKIASVFLKNIDKFLEIQDTFSDDEQTSVRFQ